MSQDKNISPVGWYVGSYQLRFVELAKPGAEDMARRFLTWTNTVLVKASGLDEAYDKVAAIGVEHTVPYKGGPRGVDVQWVFEGVVDLLPIYEELGDGAEIAWAESTKSLKTIRERTISKAEARQD